MLILANKASGDPVKKHVDALDRLNAAGYPGYPRRSLGHASRRKKARR